MKLLTFGRGEVVHPGALRNGNVVDLSHIAPDLVTLIEQGPAALAAAQEATRHATDAYALEVVSLLAPIPRPRRNVMCLGRNYAEHAKESASTWGQTHGLPEYPIFFTKAASAVSPHDGVFAVDASVSTEIDWEAELAIVIGKPGRNISTANAMEHVFGYTCLNDISARDLQKQHQQYFKGKSLDGSCPLGPWIVTADEIPDPHALRLVCRVNGEVKQDGHTGQMIFRLPEIISSLSSGMMLEAGDIIATGTPSGVGFARTPPEFLVPGDVVTVEVEAIGVLRTRIVQAS